MGGGGATYDPLGRLVCSILVRRPPFDIARRMAAAEQATKVVCETDRNQRIIPIGQASDPLSKTLPLCKAASPSQITLRRTVLKDIRWPFSCGFTDKMDLTAIA